MQHFVEDASFTHCLENQSEQAAQAKVMQHMRGFIGIHFAAEIIQAQSRTFLARSVVDMFRNSVFNPNYVPVYSGNRDSSFAASFNANKGKMALNMSGLNNSGSGYGLGIVPAGMGANNNMNVMDVTNNSNLVGTPELDNTAMMNTTIKDDERSMLGATKLDMSQVPHMFVNMNDVVGASIY